LAALLLAKVARAAQQEEGPAPRSKQGSSRSVAGGHFPGNSQRTCFIMHLLWRIAISYCYILRTHYALLAWLLLQEEGKNLAQQATCTHHRIMIICSY
jgi:hypothetical protein